jgi:heat shock protein HslJ
MALRFCLVIGALTIAACAHPVAPTTPAAATKSTASLLETDWTLAELGEQVITTPAGAGEIHFVMQSKNQSVTGFSGCNRMMGSYVLQGPELRFERMAGTMMACAANMELEKKFLAMFSQVARWEIAGESLRLLDVDGKTLATFAARAPQ